jgi:hypothetical protein
MMPRDIVGRHTDGSPPLGAAGQIAGVGPSLPHKNRASVAAVAIALIALTLPLGGCALFLAGATGAVIGYELERPHYPPAYYAPPRGYHYCFAAGGGPPLLCRNRHR